MRTRNIITAVIAVIGGSITVWKLGTSTFGIMSGLNMAVIIAIGSLYVGAILDRNEEEKQGFVVKDEMSALIEGKTGNLAFQVGNYIWLALLWYEFLSDNWLPTPTIGSPAIVLVGLMGQIGVYFVLRLYYGKQAR